MISFFRKIRRSLLSENKVTRYLPYALGEIVLVVIGILIALQINNWNEERKDRVRSMDYHERIYEDVNRLIERSTELADHAEEILRSITETVKLLEQGRLETGEQRKTVDFALVWFSRTSYRLPELTTYEEMKSNGDLGLIYDPQLRDEVAYYANYMKQVESIVFKLSNAIELDFGVFNRHLRARVDPESLEVMHEYDFDEMAADKEFINTFSRLAYHWRGYTFFMRGVARNGVKLKEKMD